MAPAPFLTAIAGGAAGQALVDAAKAKSPTLPVDLTGPQPDLFRLLGDAHRHILEHFETIAPRNGDLDLSQNEADRGFVDPDKTLRMNDVFTAVNGTPKVFKIIARQGFIAHLKGLRVSPLNPAQTMVGINVEVNIEGRTIQRVPNLDFARPFLMDRDDVLVLVVTNTTGGDVVLGYAATGWLRANKKV